MTRSSKRQVLSAVALTAAVALMLGACGKSSSGESGANGSSGTPSSPGAGASSDTASPAASGTATPGSDTAGQAPSESGDWCKTLKDTYGDLTGKTVTLYTSIVQPEDKPYIEAFKEWEKCTGATVQYDGNKDFEAQVTVRVSSGNPPDIALFPQPGLLKQVVESSGAVKPAPKMVEENVDKYFGAVWKGYGTVNGVFYAAPNSANVKSFVWYSPKAFKDAGYTVPKTWDELMALTEKIAATGKKPWCAGIASGEATGWPATDWLEDVVLRTAGPEVYDKWVAGETKFADPKISQALDKVGAILKDPKYVNGGFGGVDTIATTTFQDGGLPILKGDCFMHRQASFYSANLTDAGAKIAEDGDAFAFYLPTIGDEFGKPVLGGGEFIAAFNDRPEVQSFQTYLTLPEYANTRAKLGNFISANKGLKLESVDSDINKLSVQLLADPKATFRFDGSDLMPGAVGTGAEWSELTKWITGQDTATTMANIDAAWPAN